MDASQEIKILQSLKGDTYFAQVFKPETIDAMCENIRRDFMIDCSVDIFYNCQAAIKARGEVRTLQGQLQERHNKIEDLHEQKDEIIDFLIEQAGVTSDSNTKKNLFEKVADMIGYKELIRRKITEGYTLNNHDLEWLAKNL